MTIYNLSSPLNVVSLIIDYIRLENVSSDKAEGIKRIGAYESKIAGETVWIIDYTNEYELANKLCELNLLSFLFAGGPAGWPPAAVFDYLREKKLIEGKFKEVTWRGPGDWCITER